MTSVAGYFYDFVIATPQQPILLIADVSGHGVPTALFAFMVSWRADRSGPTQPIRQPLCFT